MKRKTMLICLASFLVFASVPGSAQAPAPTPSFTFSAGNITMPSDGNGSIPIALTSVNGFEGTVVVACAGPAQIVGVMLPYCDLPGPVASTYSLPADAKVTEEIGISASAPQPPVSKLNPLRHEGGTTLALAGALMLGLGFRRRRAFWSTHLLLAVGLLVGLVGIGASGCSSPRTLTPGAYSYNLKAYDESNSSLSVTTTVTVTVPPGIVVQ